MLAPARQVEVIAFCFQHLDIPHVVDPTPGRCCCAFSDQTSMTRLSGQARPVFQPDSERSRSGSVARSSSSRSASALRGRGKRGSISDGDGSWDKASSQFFPAYCWLVAERRAGRPNSFGRRQRFGNAPDLGTTNGRWILRPNEVNVSKPHASTITSTDAP